MSAPTAMSNRLRRPGQISLCHTRLILNEQATYRRIRETMVLAAPYTPPLDPWANPSRTTGAMETAYAISQPTAITRVRQARTSLGDRTRTLMTLMVPIVSYPGDTSAHLPGSLAQEDVEPGQHINHPPPGEGLDAHGPRHRAVQSVRGGEAADTTHGGT